jgi:biotin operon repressor
MNWNTAVVFCLISENVAEGQHLPFDQIAERLDLSTDTVGRCVDALRQDGYLDARRVKNGYNCEYTIIKSPPMLDRLGGWFYRFKAKEFWRRFVMATTADKIYHKAALVNRMNLDDADWEAQKAQLWDAHPDLHKLMAVWEPTTAIDIDQQLDDLLNWEKEHG